MRLSPSVQLGGAVLCLAYFCFYFVSPELPGPGFDGWWGWFDQGKTLQSAQALARHDLSSAAHWYPLGYALLGAPFVRWGFGAHPFVLVDLICLLVTFAAFVVAATRCGVRRSVAVGLFVVAVLWNRQVFRQWTIPWNTTPAAAVVWAVLAVGTAWLRGQRHPILLGLLAGSVPLFRPTEALPVAAALLWLLIADWREALRWPVLLRCAISALVPILVQLGLHLMIYGPALSDYQRVSRELGFTLYDFGWKAYVLMADPYPWFTDGQGLLARLPWVALAFAGFVPALWRGGPAGMIAAALIAHLVLYTSYLDLLPTGLWRYNNIHYWKWAIPGYALLAYLLLRDLVRFRLARPAWPALVGLAAVAVLSLIRIAPLPAAQGEPAKMIVFSGPAPGFDSSYFGNFSLADAAGPLRSVLDVRAIPVPGGMRVLALRRDFTGDIRMTNPNHLAPTLFAAPPERWAERIVLGRPCWLAIARCGKRAPDPLLPPPP